MARKRKGMGLMEKRLFGINEVADYLSLSPQTIRNKLRAGTFPVEPRRLFGRKLLWDKRELDLYISRGFQGKHGVTAD